MVNSVISAAADTGDSALGAADYGADATMALTACAVGDSYCNKALSDLSGKSQAVADRVTALMKIMRFYITLSMALPPLV